MAPLVLALNAGSSSVKASVLQGDAHRNTCLAEKLGSPDAVLHMNFGDDDENPTTEEPNMNHEQAMKKIIKELEKVGLLQEIVAVGHRVVHGGTIFDNSVLIDDSVLHDIDCVSHLAPL